MDVTQVQLDGGDAQEMREVGVTQVQLDGASHRRCGKLVQGFHAFSLSTTVLAAPPVNQLLRFLIPSFWVFMELNLQPLFSPGGWGACVHAC